ncbi:MAG: hypothetical protein HY302_03915 [Opitutae bacterium]|nr:hypothetical protein [Opitutae bacterium]
MRWFFGLMAGLLLAGVAAAQTGAEIAQRHAERAGAKLAKLTAYRAVGRTFIGDQEVPFTMWAQRPDRLRIESSTPSRRLVQVYDGVHPPWTSHSEVEGGAPQLMTGSEAREFVANADFDDPLVDFAAKHYTVDYAGEDEVEGRAAHKLLVMSPSDDLCFLWVDAETSEIVRRMTYRIVQERRAVIDTYFKDFRPVAGVMFPHKIEARTNGRAIYTTLIDKMEPNPKKMRADLFARPGGWPEERKVEELKPDAPKADEAHPAAPATPEAKTDDPKSGAPQSGDPSTAAPKADEPKATDPELKAAEPAAASPEEAKPAELLPEESKPAKPKADEAPRQPEEPAPAAVDQPREPPPPGAADQPQAPPPPEAGVQPKAPAPADRPAEKPKEKQPEETAAGRRAAAT